jgi:soluble lytic murein transglycosylase-like protein
VEVIFAILKFIPRVHAYEERKYMKRTLVAGIIASVVLGACYTIPAEAACGDRGNCPFSSSSSAKHAVRPAPTKAKSTKHISRSAVYTSGKRTTAVRSAAKSKRYAAKSTQYAGKRKRYATAGHHPKSLPTSGRGGNVVALIKAMAPAQGVPTWFALRIARVESNYNPSLRGQAGEYGVFQMKCATARGIGFSGNCSALLNPRINVQYGLRHLSLAMKSSRGNLRLAASKHNGGLGRKTEIRGYIAKVF